MAENKETFQRFGAMHREALGCVNLNPLQRGGVLTEAARTAASEWADGYSVCDFCGGSLHDIKKPPIDVFTREVLPRFLNVDAVRVTNGARESKYVVMHAMCQKGDPIVVDANAHYSTFVAAERAGLVVHEVPSSGRPEYRIDAEKYAQALDAVKPKLAVLTYPDGSYGNVPDAARIGKICADRGVPFMLNCAYSIGRMPVDAKKLNADFVVASGHKSMAASGPVGLLGAKKEYSDIVFRKSARFKAKEVELLGCTARGLPIITLMASFSEVASRVGKWDDEVAKARRFASEIGAIDGMTVLGESPRKHDLVSVESELFFRISERHKKGRFFLYHELKERGIVGIKPGNTRNFKISTYQLSDQELSRVIDAFKEIATI